MKSLLTAIIIVLATAGLSCEAEKKPEEKAPASKPAPVADATAAPSDTPPPAAAPVKDALDKKGDSAVAAPGEAPKAPVEPPVKAVVPEKE